MPVLRPPHHPPPSGTANPASSIAQAAPAFLQPTSAGVERQGPERGVLLGGRFIKLEQGPDLFGNTAYSVIMDFCKDREDDVGDLVTFDYSFSISVLRNTLTALVRTDRGERKLSSGDLWLAAKTWYQVALVFSGAAGRADLLLDGHSLAAVGGLRGATQIGNVFAELYIGSPKGKGFTGRIDNFRFLDGAVAERELGGSVDASAP